MQKFMKKICAVILCVAMVGSMLPQVVSAAETEYQIYPTPHTMTYESGSYELEDLNVIYGNGMDDATEARLEETADLLGLDVTEATAADATKTNVYVAIYGSDDAAAEYIADKYTFDASLFTKTDANFVSSNNGEIVVLGKDVDACYYGLTTLYHVFTQVTDGTIRNFTISDYADVVSRGFIEGYYGNPWSTEDRVNLMTWGGYYKLNSYFYAPKDDPKHNAKWKELYTPEEIETKIKPLAVAGNASKCRFVYALHPYMYNAIRYNAGDAAYQEDLAAMQAKFEQVIEAGVRQIAILADDASNVGGSNYIKTLQDMTNWIKEKQVEYPDLKLTLPFCTQEYMGNGESYYANFPENVQIVMTGGRVWGEVSNNFTTTFTNNVGRGPYLWINWPCTDNSKKHLIMGGYTTFLQAGVNPSNIQGIVLNPMQQSEPSKVAIFGNACYSWNIWETNDEANAAWDASFSYVDHNNAIPNAASNALKELSKHMINQNMDSRVTALQESVELKEVLNAFKAKLDANTVTDADIDAVIEEFEVLAKAAKTYRNEAGDENVRDQIVYWLNCWDDTTTAAISYLNALKALNNGEDDAVVWDYFAVGQAAFENSKTYGFHYVDHTEYAEVGVQHIVPFISKLDQILSLKASLIVDPSKQVITYITNRTDTPTGNVTNVLDNSPSTEIVYKNPNAISAGTYVGISYVQPIDIDKVIFRMAPASNRNDTFQQARVEYTTDGSTWTAVNDELYSMPYEVELENLGLEGVKGIRLIATQDRENTWLGVRDIVVNPEEVKNETVEYTTSISVDKISARVNSDNSVIDNDMNSYAHYAEYPYKPAGATIEDYIPENATVTLTFSQVIPLGVISMKQDSGTDKIQNFAIEYSANGSDNWTLLQNYTNGEAEVTLDVGTQGITAKAVRLRNNALHLNSAGTNGWWWKLYNFNVTPYTEDSEYNTDNVYTNTNANLRTKYSEACTTMKAVAGLTLEAGEYVGLDLGRIKDLSEITVEGQNGLTLQVSKNEVDWVTVTAGDVTEDARYIRLINNTDAAITTSVTKFEVASDEVASPFLHETTMGINGSWGVDEDCRNNGAAFDGNVSTMTEFGDLPQKDQYIIYDLGQERDIYKLEIYCQDSALNYIRDAVMSVSNDLTNWTNVLTIGDGVQNEDDASVKCIDSDAGYSQTTSSYPNIVSIEGEITPTPARYIKILMTATNNNRAVVFNEIEINEGEYVSVTNDPTFETSAIEVQGYVPQNMIDGDLTTSYKANTTEAGYVIYTFSDNLEANRINVVQKGVSNAKVSIYAENDGVREWKEVATLDKSLVTVKADNDLNLAMKIEWEAGQTPNITEIVRYSVDEVEEPTPTPSPEPTPTPSPEPSPEPTPEPTPGPDDSEHGDGYVCVDFEDVAHGAWYEEAVQYVFEKEIMTGIGDTTKFEPESQVIRAVVIETLYKMEGRPEVDDLEAPALKDFDENDWWSDALTWAYRNGIATGNTHTNTFDGMKVVTREEVATFLYRYAKYKTNAEIEVDDTVLGDTEVSDWAKDGFAWVVENAIITGIETETGLELAPEAGAIRAQLATIMMRYCEK